MTNELLKEHLVGRKIVDARYMTQEEMDDLMWCDLGILFVLDNGTQAIVQQDAEGNGPGRIILTTKTKDRTN